MPKKSILFVYYKLFNPSGVAQAMITLANELVDEGYNVDFFILSADLPHIYHIDKRIKVHYMDSYAHWICKTENFFINHLSFIPKAKNFYAYLFHLGVFSVLRQWLNDNHHRYDTIISCWYKLSKLISFLPQVREKTLAWEHISHTVGGLFFNQLLGNRYQYIKGVICINSAGEKFYSKINPNTHKIYNIINAECEKKKFIPARYKENIITMICRLEAEKNISEFLDIIKHANIPNDWQVQIMGDGSLYQPLKQKCEEERIHNVIFLGRGTPQQVFQLLEKSKICCLTSKAEGLPTILLEAMFHSNALISYDCSYGPSDIINENNGFLIPLHNKKLFKEKLEYLINSSKTYEKLNESAYQESKKWKKDKILPLWKEII